MVIKQGFGGRVMMSVRRTGKQSIQGVLMA
jgi:hypothetical protein